jgi:hypothetical protein
MATPTVESTPSGAVAQPQRRWQLILLKAAGFGAGAVLMLAVLAVVGYWYSQRPKQPTEWQQVAFDKTAYLTEAIFSDLGVPEATPATSKPEPLLALD